MQPLAILTNRQGVKDLLTLPRHWINPKRLRQLDSFLTMLKVARLLTHKPFRRLPTLKLRKLASDDFIEPFVSFLRGQRVGLLLQLFHDLPASFESQPTVA